MGAWERELRQREREMDRRQGEVERRERQVTEREAEVNRKERELSTRELALVDKQRKGKGKGQFPVFGINTCTCPCGFVYPIIYMHHANSE